MKRYIVIVLLTCLALVGCSRNGQAEEEKRINRFAVAERGNYWTVVYDKNTRVMYVVSDVAYNRGTFTVMVDADGKPLLYEGE